MENVIIYPNTCWLLGVWPVQWTPFCLVLLWVRSWNHREDSILSPRHGTTEISAMLSQTFRTIPCQLSDYQFYIIPGQSWDQVKSLFQWNAFHRWAACTVWTQYPSLPGRSLPGFQEYTWPSRTIKIFRHQIEDGSSFPHPQPRYFGDYTKTVNQINSCRWKVWFHPYSKRW